MSFNNATSPAGCHVSGGGEGEGEEDPLPDLQLWPRKSMW